VITDWTAEPGETVLHRARISFATGAAVPVSGLRWFRDTERNDIQRELPGWPDGPVYTVHTPAQQTARWGGRFLRTGVPALIGAAIEALGGTGSGINPKILGQPTERENEVNDFPVMWAAPGTIARTLPWQLDPARRPKDHSTFVVITDRRIVLLLQGPQEESAPEELGRLSRDDIVRVERMKFSHGEHDVRIWFRDESWARVAIPDQDLGVLLHLETAPVFLTDEDLSAPQREAVTKWLARWPLCDEPPQVMRLRSGNVMIQQRVPASRSGMGYLTQSCVIGSDGAPAYDPSDY
jgi:hypothetical protein